MRGSTLMLCSFLVLLVAVERCHGSRSDVRHQLRSEVVYSERNHKEGRYKYGYAVKKGETQFHHQRSLDGAMYGCYGYVDPQGKLFITHYLADMAGYRLVNMANPDRKLAERIRNLGTVENPIDLQHLFPAECQEDGDIKTLQETADAMKASLAESGDQSASYQSRSSSYHSVSANSQDSTARGPVGTVKSGSQGTQFTSNQQYQAGLSGTVVKTQTVKESVDQSTSFGLRSVSSMQSLEGKESKTGGSVDLVKSSATNGVDLVKSNQLQTDQQNNVGFKATSGSIDKVSNSGIISNQQTSLQQTSVSESSADFLKSNVNRGSNIGKTAVKTLATKEPKFVMKSVSKDSSVRLAATDSSSSSTFKKTGTEQKIIGSGTAFKVGGTASGFQDSVEKSKFMALDKVDQTLHVVSNGSSFVKYTSGKQQSVASNPTLISSGDAEEATQLMDTKEIAGSLKTSSGSDESTQNIAVEENKKTSEGFNASPNRVKVTNTNQGLTMINNESGSTSNAEKFGTNDIKINKEVKENIEKHMSGESADHSKEARPTKSIVKQQTYGASEKNEDTGSRATDNNAVGTTKTMQTNTHEETSVVKTVQDSGINQIHGKYQSAESMKSSEKFQSEKIADRQQSSNLKISKSDSATGHQVTNIQQDSVEALKDTFAGELAKNQPAISLGRKGEMDQVVKTSAEFTEKEDSTGVKTLDREFLNIGERKTVTFGQASSGKENVESVRSVIVEHAQASGSSTTTPKVEDSTSTGKANVMISSSGATAKGNSISFVRQSEQKDLQELLDNGTAKSTVLQDGNHAGKDSLTLDSTFIKSERTSSANEKVESTSLRTDGSTRKLLSGASVSRGKEDSMMYAAVETGKGSSKTVVSNLEQKASKNIEDQVTKKSIVLVSSELVSKVEVTSDSKTASNINTNVRGQAEKASAKSSDVNNYQEINLRFDDESSEQPSKVESYSSTSSKTHQDADSGRSSSAVNRGTVKYADYATENKQLKDHTKGSSDVKILETQRKNQRSKARNQQGTQLNFHQNGSNNPGISSSNERAESEKETASNSQKAAVTIAEYVKNSSTNDASKQVTLKDTTQTESVKQSTDMSTKQDVKSAQKANSQLEYNANKQKIGISAEQKMAKDGLINKESSSVNQDSENVQTRQKFESKQEYGTNKQNSEVSADQNKAEDRSVTELKQDYKQSEVVQTQRASESSSGRSFNQVKSKQSVQQVKETSQDSTPIIRFAIPGIIQQGPPVQGRRSFVGIPNNYLNSIFPTNSQSRVGTLPVDDEGSPRSEVQRLPATPRTTTPASPDAVTVSYHLASGTDRTPVTPRPTTGVRPVTPGFPATTEKSLISKTTVGPSGDIYDEIEEELDLGSRPTLMSPQIPAQKPPSHVTSISSGGVTVIPSISQGVTVEQTGLPHCYEVSLQIPSDAKQIFVRTNSPAFRVFGDGDPNERIRLVEPGVYEVNLGATSGIQFNQYQADDGTWKRSNKLQLDVDRSFDYGELVQKPLYSRTQSSHYSPTSGDGISQARLNNPYLPLVPAAAPVEARNAGGSEEEVLTPEQRSLLSLVPSWKKVLLYY